MRKQRREKDFWKEYKDFQLKSSFDKLKFDNSSLDKQSTNEKSLEVNNKKGDNILEGLGDNNEEIQLKNRFI